MQVTILSKAICAMVICFIVSMLVYPLYIEKLKQKKLNQEILVYVDQHNSKKGTPTFGGIIFILSTVVVSFIFYGTNNSFVLVSIATILGFGSIGFFDDLIKTKNKDNQGLKPWQKIIGQLLIALALSIFCFYDKSIGSTIFIPFINTSINLGVWIIPLNVIFYIAVTNSVNLTDGLDGLAGSVSSVVIITISIIIGIISMRYFDNGMYGDANKLSGISVFGAALLGGLLAFMWHNSNPANIFMGDTGSLALGGVIASMLVMTKFQLLILIVGISYVVSSISVIIQVSYFKLSKGRRLFKMAPFHHHLEKCGYNETKIVSFYYIITFLLSLVTILGV